MNLFIAVQNLGKGGPSNFIIRLACELANKGHNVFVYELYPYLSKTNKHSFKKSKLKLLSPADNKIADFFAWRLNSLSSKKSYWEKFRKKNMIKQIRINKIDVILSIEFSVDIIMAEISLETNIPLAVRLNSDYGIQKNKKPLKEHIKTIQKILVNTDALIFTSDYHYKKLNKHIKNIELKKAKIINGIKKQPDIHISEKHPFKINNKSIIFGMVSRGEPEKGWEILIKAFKNIQENKENNIFLILVGESDYMQNLKKTTSNKNVFFAGHSDQPGEWIQQFHIAVLPTYYKNESTPNVVLEYLSYNKPVISTNHVEIPNMISFNNQYAGKLIDLKDNHQPEIADLENAMLDYISNPDLIIQHSELTKDVIKRFGISKCADEYIHVLNSIKSE